MGAKSAFSVVGACLVGAYLVGSQLVSYVSAWWDAAPIG